LRNLDEAGRQRHAATRAERDAMALAVAAETARGCIGRLSLDARLDVTREMVRSRAESLRIAEDQARVGYTSQLQRTQAQAEYEVVAQAVPALELAVRQQENALHILMGDLPGDLPRVNLAELTPPTVPGTLSSTLLRHRPDLAVAELSLAATDATLAARRAEFLPNVSLSWVLAGLFVNARDYDPVTIWNVGASVLAPIFSGGRLTAQVDVALARRDQAGHASYLEELDAQRNRFSAQREAIVLRERQLANLVTLYAVLGGGWTGVRTAAR
jgi:outer membrane protein TolC